MDYRRLIERVSRTVPSRKRRVPKATSADGDQRPTGPVSKGQRPRVRVQKASVKRASTLQQPASLRAELTGVARHGKALPTKSLRGFWDHRSLRWSFSFWWSRRAHGADVSRTAMRAPILRDQLDPVALGRCGVWTDRSCPACDQWKKRGEAGGSRREREPWDPRGPVIPTEACWPMTRAGKNPNGPSGL